MRASSRLTSTDPWTNLATERYLFEHLGEDDHRLLIWRNDRCVVIGRHQNPWQECDLGRMAADDVPLVRRISGGGTVYHDPGNINVSFMGSEAIYDLDRQFNVMLNALHELGIPAERTKRNDLVIPGKPGERKFSGSAFRHTKGRSLHHSTLLLNADLNRLTTYLAPPPLGITSKSIASVRAVVVNLTEVRPALGLEKLVAALEAAYERTFGPAVRAGIPAHETDAARREAETEIDRYRRELRSWEWLYGKTPPFSREVRVPVAALPAGPRERPAPRVGKPTPGEMEHEPTASGSKEALPARIMMRLAVRHGVIESVGAAGGLAAQGDAETIAVLNSILSGTRYVADDIRDRAAETSTEIRGTLHVLADEIAHTAIREG